MFGAVHFFILFSPFAHVVTLNGHEQQQYAYDTQLFVAISRLHRDTALSRQKECRSVFHILFCHNGLALNPDKCDAIKPGSTRRAKSITLMSNINVAGASVPLSTSWHNP